MEDIEKANLQIQKLIESVNLKLEDKLLEVDKLELYKKQLLLLEKRINYFNKKGEENCDELKSQKTILVLKIDEIENAISYATEFFEIGKMIKETYSSFDPNSTKKPKDIKLINKFNGIIEPNYNASKAYILLKEKVNEIDVTELANTINVVCNLKNNEKMYVLNEKIISRNVIDFHNTFLNFLKSNLKIVLVFSKTKKTLFTPSDMLKFYINYILKMKSIDSIS